MRLPLGAARERMLNEVTDSRTPRTLRYEALSNLALGTCGSDKGVLFGHPEHTQSRFEEARASLTRFPSEDAVLDLYYNGPQQAITESARSIDGYVVLGAAAVTATLTSNPRVMTCTRLLSAIR